MKTKKPKEEQVAERTYEKGGWVAMIYGANADAKAKAGTGAIKKEVVVMFNGRKYFETHGEIAYQGAIDFIDHAIERGYEPKMAPVKCMADYGESRREAIGRKAENNSINPAHVGADFLEGLV